MPDGTLERAPPRRAARRWARCAGDVTGVLSRAAARLLTVPPAVALALLLAAGASACGGGPAPADLLVTGGTVWTGVEGEPAREVVAVEDGRIVAVGPASELDAYRGPGTEVLDVDGAFVAPGFIDSHTHFGRAGSLLLGVNLLQVSDEEGLVREVRAARDRLPSDAWIVGGDWGAYRQWSRGATGRERAPAGASSGSGTEGAGGRAAGAGQGRRPGEGRPEPFRPHRAMIDSVTPRTPVLLSRWDHELYLANARALEAADVACGQRGVVCEGGELTGLLDPAAAGRVRDVIPEESMERRLAEARAALRRLRRAGVTTIHDVTPADQLRVFQRLRALGQLTTRVYARPILDEWDDLRAAGIRHGFGDERLKIGGLKGFVDGIMGNSSARFYEPYLTTGERGSWREMMREPPGMQRLLIGADSSGHWPQVHAIGDQAIDTLLTMFERVKEVNGEEGGVPLPAGDSSFERERRFRVIHAQVLRGPEVAERMAELEVIAEVQPYHAIDDMRWMEERIGERARWAYAFKTMKEAGVRLSFGSDWPGTNASWYPTSPLLGIYAAVTRQTLDGEPEGGWYPEERVSVETALHAYTVNNAYAAGEEEIKGTLEPGKLADLVVLDRSPFAVEPSTIKELEVLHTVVGGQVVYSRR